jgi:YD repeat-containing protein
VTLALIELLIKGEVMKTRNPITTFLTTALAVAVLCGAGWLKPVAAQTGDDTVTLVAHASVGIATGEGVRLSMANHKKSGGNLMMKFSFYPADGSIDSSTVPLYESEWIVVPPGEFRSTDVWRKDLKTDGEPQTRRQQVLATMVLMGIQRSNQDDCAGSLEVIEEDAQTGDTIPGDSKYRLLFLAPKSSKQLDAPISLLPEHRVRYTVLNEETEPVTATGYTYDSLGTLTSQTAPVRLGPGETHTFDVNYDDLRVKVEDGSGRKQMSGVVQFALMDGSVRPVKVHIWREVVNDRTGSSAGGEYFTGTVSVSGDGLQE